MDDPSGTESRNRAAGLIEADGTDASASAIIELSARIKSGASWFYWIAGLTFANSLLSLFGVWMEFLLGMMLTRGLRAFFAGFFAVSVPNTTFEPWLLPALVAEGLVVLGLVGLGYLASRGSRKAFAFGISLYALDGLMFFVEGLLASALAHLLVLAFLIRGYSAAGQARTVMEVALEASPGTAPRWPRFAIAGMFLPFAFTLVVGFVGFMGGGLADRILARAPEEFSQAERERLRLALAALDQWFRDDGPISGDESRRMNEALIQIQNTPPGELASVEELREFTLILESIAGEKPDAVVTIKAGDAPRIERVRAGMSPDQAAFSTQAFRFYSPDTWLLAETEDAAEASQIRICLGSEERATIAVRVDSLPANPAERIAALPNRLGEAYSLEACEQDWGYFDWGTHEGRGEVYRCRRNDLPIQVKFFASPLADGRTLEIHQVYVSEAEMQVSEAEYAIQRSLSLGSAG